MAELPGIHNAVLSARLLASGESVVASKPGPLTVRLELPAQPPDPYVSVIAIQYEGPLEAEKYAP